MGFSWQFVWEGEDMKMLRHLWRRTSERHELPGIVTPRRSKHSSAFTFECSTL